jgi:valyl-tRNA synthetase
MPFVTEELWHHLPGTDGYIVKARFPGAVPEFADKDAIAEAEAMMEIISGIRNIRSEAGVHPGAVVDVMVIPHSEKASAIFRDCGAYIKQMARVNEITMLSGDAAKPSGALSLILADLEVFVPVEGLVDVEGELARLAREEKKLSKEISRLDGKLSNQGFLSKAPAEVVQKERDRLAEAEARMEKIEAHKKMLMEI